MRRALLLLSLLTTFLLVTGWTVSLARIYGLYGVSSTGGGARFCNLTIANGSCQLFFLSDRTLGSGIPNGWHFDSFRFAEMPEIRLPFRKRLVGGFAFHAERGADGAILQLRIPLWTGLLLSLLLFALLDLLLRRRLRRGAPIAPPVSS